MPNLNHSRLRPQTARLVCRLASVLLDSGTITGEEYNIISRNLHALAKTGELAPAIAPKLLTPQEVAEMLAISYSQLRSLEKEGAFPFRRKLVGNKTVRFRNTDIYDYINASNTNEKQTNKRRTVTMQEYQAIIEKFGEPFPTEGRRNPRVNPIFFAAAFQQDTQVKYFHDVGWLKMENDRWLAPLRPPSRLRFAI